VTTTSDPDPQPCPDALANEKSLKEDFFQTYVCVCGVGRGRRVIPEGDFTASHATGRVQCGLRRPQLEEAATLMLPSTSA
jgi:hypothetical protein